MYSQDELFKLDLKNDEEIVECIGHWYPKRQEHEYINIYWVMKESELADIVIEHYEKQGY